MLTVLWRRSALIETLVDVASRSVGGCRVFSCEYCKRGKEKRGFRHSWPHSPLQSDQPFSFFPSHKQSMLSTVPVPMHPAVFHRPHAPAVGGDRHTPRTA